MMFNDTRIGIIGLGYVGLPLAVAFASKYNVVGYDINQKRVGELLIGNDRTLEIDNNCLASVLNGDNRNETGLSITSDVDKLKVCNVFIVTVPTPIDRYNRPVLEPLIKATETVGSILKRGNIVIYESTVYPGVTEDEMVPILESMSGLIYNKDFYCGYSPERINPGDKDHTVTNILKVTSGSNSDTATKVDELYKSIILAGTYKAPSIKVAEAAKVIENAQRDINIAFINELSKIFNLMCIDTNEVLEAAGTKWNFLKFKPGLVGGHCIGVDPYYLAQKAQEIGYNPEIILSGRRLNDSMGSYVASEVVKLMIRKNINIMRSDVLILGFTFKENCPDVRNTRVIDIYNELMNYEVNVSVYDPWLDLNEVKQVYGINVMKNLPEGYFSAVILAVAHNEFLTLDVRSFAPNGIVYDVKGILPKETIDARL